MPIKIGEFKPKSVEMISSSIEIGEFEPTTSMNVGEFNADNFKIQSDAVREPSFIEKWFGPEIGAVDSIMSRFRVGSYSDLATKDVKRQEELRIAFKNAPAGEHKDKLREMLINDIENPAFNIIEEGVPEIHKTTSQALGEAITLGLLVVPIPAIKAFKSSSFFKRAIAGASIGGIFGGALGMAEEGELQDKVPEIAVAAGIGAVGNGVLTGMLPPVIKGIKSGIKKIFDIVNIKRIPNDVKSNTVLPIIREVERDVGKVKTEPIKELLSPIKQQARQYKTAEEFIASSRGQKAMKWGTFDQYRNKFDFQDLEEVIKGNKPSALISDVSDDLISKYKGVAEKQGLKFSLLKDEAGRVSMIFGKNEQALKLLDDALTSKLKKGEQYNRRLGLALGYEDIGIKTKSQLKQIWEEVQRLDISKELTIGDQIFSKDMGRINIQQFSVDDVGNSIVLGSNVNGRMVTLLPEDLVGMKKILKPNKELVTEFVGLAALPERRIVLSQPQKIWNGVKAGLIRTSKQIESMGSSGKQLIGLIDNTIDDSRRFANKAIEPMTQFINQFKLNKKKFKFTSDELKNIVDILDEARTQKALTVADIKGVEFASERVKLFVKTFSDITKQLVNQADKMGLKIRDKSTGKLTTLGEATLHYPHVPKDIEKFMKHFDEIVTLQMKRQNLSRREATHLLNSFVDEIASTRFAGLEKRRTLLIQGFDELEKFGYEVDPMTALTDFVEGATRRLTEAQILGKNDELVSRLIRDIGLSGYDEKIARKLWDSYTNNRGVAASFKAVSQAFRTWQMVTKLALAGPVNATQMINTASQFSTRKLAKNFTKFMISRNTRMTLTQRARFAGVSDRVIDSAIQLAGGGGKSSSRFLKNVFFTQIEKFNRIMTVATSQDWAKASLTKLIKNPTNNKLRRNLEKLGVDVRKAIQRGRFTEVELEKLGQKAVQAAQFRGSVLDIPLLWNSEQGKVLTQFKSFIFQQGVFMKEVILGELAKGNLHPLVTYMLLSQVGGEGIRDIRDLLKGKTDFREQMGVVERVIDNQLTVGGIGIYGDIFRDLYDIAEGRFWVSTMDFMAGPTASDISNALDSSAMALGGNPRPFVKLLARQITALALLPGIRNVPGSGIMLKVGADLVINLTDE